MQHSITLLLDQIAWRCIVLLKNERWSCWAQTRWDGMLLQNVVVTVLFKCWSLDFCINHQQCHQQSTITRPPPCFTVGTRHVNIIRSPSLTEKKVPTLDSSYRSTDFYWCNVCLGLLVSFFEATQSWPRPDSCSFLSTIDVMCLNSEMHWSGL